jgi:hypothetical protein
MAVGVKTAPPIFARLDASALPASRDRAANGSLRAILTTNVTIWSAASLVGLDHQTKIRKSNCMSLWRKAEDSSLLVAPPVDQRPSSYVYDWIIMKFSK